MKFLIAAMFLCLVVACSFANEDVPSAGSGGDEAAPVSQAPTVTTGGTTEAAPLSTPDSGGDSPNDDGVQPADATPPTTSPDADPTDSSGPSSFQPEGPLPTTTPIPYVAPSGPGASDSGNQSPSPQDSGSHGTLTMFGPLDCEGYERVQFSYFPLDTEIISSIRPMGSMSGSHVTPVDHIYITHDSRNIPGHGYVVRMPADGIVVQIGRMPNADRPDYRIVIAHSCRIFTTFIHTGAPNPELTALTGDLELGSNWYGAFPIKAGDVLADASTNTMDFMVHDEEVTLPGFIVPESYEGEGWKIHTLDPFDFYDEPLRSQVLVFNQRTAEPVGGKIDYDIDGRIVGNWFVEGTGGYSSGGAVLVGYENYWETHLAIAYHYIDPTTLIVSIGADVGIPDDACNVCNGAYGIKGNAPDPATVGVSDGLVKYELIGRLRPERDAPTYNDESNSIGVFLVEMIDDRSIRVEVFPDVLPAGVSGFTDAAVVYTR